MCLLAVLYNEVQKKVSIVHTQAKLSAFCSFLALLPGLECWNAVGFMLPLVSPSFGDPLMARIM